MAYYCFDPTAYNRYVKTAFQRGDNVTEIAPCEVATPAKTMDGYRSYFIEPSGTSEGSWFYSVDINQEIPLAVFNLFLLSQLTQVEQNGNYNDQKYSGFERSTFETQYAAAKEYLAEGKGSLIESLAKSKNKEPGALAQRIVDLHYVTAQHRIQSLMKANAIKKLMGQITSIQELVEKGFIADTFDFLQRMRA